jgi:hypothetical protein
MAVAINVRRMFRAWRTPGPHHLQRLPSAEGRKMTLQRTTQNLISFNFGADLVIVFFYVASCTLVNIIDVLEVVTASIIRSMMETVSISETSVNLHQINGATPQKTVIFILITART